MKGRVINSQLFCLKTKDKYRILKINVKIILNFLNTTFNYKLDYWTLDVRLLIKARKNLGFSVQSTEKLLGI